MQFRVSSYRQGFELLSAAGAWEEIASSLESVTLARIEELRRKRQAELVERAKAEGGKPRKAGIQDGLNTELHRLLTHMDRAWRSEVPLYKADEGTGKGYWTMDFHKFFPGDTGVGIEVTFNHAEALPWTLIRPSLAYQADDVLPDSRIQCGVVIIGTDHLKGSRARPEGLRMDSAVGTYERLLSLLPRLKWVVPVPLTVIGLDWADGKLSGTPNRVNLHRPVSASIVSDE